MEFAEEITRLLRDAGIGDPQLEVPPASALGDYAMPCFLLSATRRKAPAVLAQEIMQLLQTRMPHYLERIEAAGPYVNFFLKRGVFAANTLERISTEGERYGALAQRGERVMIEYSQPNTHKAFHVGHLRGTCIGEALARILRHAGYTVIQANYSGDTGSHISKWLWYYTTHDQSEPPSNLHERESWIAQLYVRAVKALTDEPEREGDVREVLRQLETHSDPELERIYQQTRQWSIDAFTVIYNDLHAHFDRWFFESDMEARGKEIAHELVARGIAKEDQGAIIVDLEPEQLGIWVLLRQDGTALYSAKDLALAEIKFNEYRIDRSIYIIGAAQAMHMKQLFATLRRMGFAQTDKCYHLSMNEVRLPTGKMSSRSGQNMLYSDVRTEIAAFATAEVVSRHPDWDQERIKGVVDQVIVAALKFDMLAIDPNKPIVFDTKRATEFEGETGPYLQYTYARSCSILAKVGNTDATQGDGSTLTNDHEQRVLRELAMFPGCVARAAKEYAPSLVAHQCMELAKSFNSFYHECPVLQANGQQRNDRLALVRAVRAVLSKGLELLAIDAPAQM